MPQFRKKPVVIEAIQWTGDNGEEVQVFVGASSSLTPDMELTIHTLEGDHRANVGDWIIRGVKGEFYPCKPDIFDATYDLATYDLAPAPVDVVPADGIVRDDVGAIVRHLRRDEVARANELARKA